MRSNFAVDYKGIVDIAVKPTPLTEYRFLSPSGPVTISGFYVDGHGKQIGTNFFAVVLNADGTNAPVAFPSVPVNATGVIFKTSAILYYSLSGDAGIVANFKTNYLAYPEIGPSKNLTGGAV